jgi:hypothetical protein
MGALVTSASIAVVAEGFGRVAAILLLAGIILSNLPYGARPSLQCTLCERIHELGETHPSGSDAVVSVAKMLPSGARTVFIPDYLAQPAMFYRPDLRYAAVLDPNKNIDPELRRVLPDYVFKGTSAIDVLVIGIGSVPLSETIDFAGVNFKLEGISNTNWVDMTRPEIPWHEFRSNPANDQKFGIAVFRRADTPTLP